MNLKNMKLKEEDLCFNEEQDRIFTYLVLMDYDWMWYRIQAEIPLKDRLNIRVEFSYTGTIDSLLTVETGEERIQYVFPSSIFDNYFEKYLSMERNAIKEESVFYGGNLILDFYNAVMENYIKINDNPTDYIAFPQ